LKEDEEVKKNKKQARKTKRPEKTKEKKIGRRRKFSREICLFNDLFLSSTRDAKEALISSRTHPRNRIKATSISKKDSN